MGEERNINKSNTKPEAHQSEKRFWEQKAHALAFRVNFAWWLQAFLPIATGLSFIFALSLLLSRKSAQDPSLYWAIYVCTLLVAAIAALRIARKNFFGVQDSLAKLDLKLKLHNRLTAASSGVGPWPNPKNTSALKYKHERIFIPLAASLTVIAFAAWLPVSIATARPSKPQQQPVAWDQVEDWLEELETGDVVDEEALQELEAKLEELRELPPESWYDHSSLEAGDQLREELERSMRSLKSDMERMESLLRELDSFEDPPIIDGDSLLKRKLDETLENLELGRLRLNKEAIEKLKDMIPKDTEGKNIRAATPEELQKLRELLQQGIEDMDKALENSKESDEIIAFELDAWIKNQGDAGDGSEQGSSSGGSGGQSDEKGKPGISRGPGSVPLTMHNRPRVNTDDKIQILSSNKPDMSAEGEVVETSRGEHEVDKSEAHTLNSAGSIAGDGSGGEAVWQGEYSPREKDILKNYFQ